MIPENDKDIKIFGKEKKSQAFDILNIVNTLDEQRENNNVKKAKELGQELAKVCFSDEFIASLNSEYTKNGDCKIQLLSLVFFAVKASMNLFLPSPVLFPICEDAFYEELQSQKPKFYSEMIQNPSLSFYYLSLRKETNQVDIEIAKDFAKFCNKENDDKYIKEGQRIYNFILNFVSQLIKDKNFTN
ncbi:MAG: hypothetical protein Q4E28_00895 [Clostridia bacterium]|nr:hypothetical protein [Clostridia bacterium]